MSLINNKKKLIIVLIAFLLSGCSVGYRAVLGIDISPEWMTSGEIRKDFEKRKIPKDQSFLLDTASYSNLVRSEYFKKVEELKSDSIVYDSIEIIRINEILNNDLQPVQVRYFTSSGEPIFKMINCYIEPLIPMTWNVEGCFDVFPPKTISNLENDENENLEFFLPHIKTLDGDSVTFQSLPKADYYAVVFWNSFMIRPSKKIIKLLVEYNKKHKDQITYFLFVNNHNAEIWSYCDEEQRREVEMELEEVQLTNHNK